jgi:hypothetical protein
MARKATISAKAKKQVSKKRKVKMQAKEIKVPVRISRQTLRPFNLIQGRQAQGKLDSRPTRDGFKADKQQIAEKDKETKKEVYQEKKIERKIKQKGKKIKQPSFITKTNKPVKTDKDKRFLMWSGVIFFMIIIFAVWIFNLRSVFKTSRESNINDSAFEEWEKISDDFSETLEKVKEGMSQLKDTTESGLTEQEGEQTTERNVFSESATTTENEITEEEQINDINELKRRLEELESQMKAEQATTTIDN